MLSTGNKSVKNTLFRSSVLFSTLTVLMMGVIFSFILFKQKISAVSQIIEDRNSYLNNFMDNFLRETKNTIDFLSSMEIIIYGEKGDEPDRAAVLDIYRLITDTNDYITYLYSGYADGTLLINDYETPEDFDPRLRPWYINALENSPEASVCEPYQEFIDKTWLSATSRTLIDSQGEVTGVVALDYNLNLLNILLRKTLTNYNSAYSYIFRDGGEMIIHYHPDRVKHNLFEEVPEISPADFTEGRGTFSYAYDGVKKTAFYSKIPSADWVIVTAVDKKEILVPIIQDIILVLTTVFLLSLFLGYTQSNTLARRIIQPLQQLKQHTEILVKGKELPQTAFHYPDNEIGHIAKRTMEMAGDELLKKNRVLEEQRKELLTLSNTDQLTGIANRRHLDTFLKQEYKRYLRTGSPFCLCLIDLDHFKIINDTWGHDTGDSVLVKVAEIFCSTLRQTDIPGRWGGEEFLIICPDTTLEGAAALAEKTRFAVESFWNNKPETVTVSMGIAEIDKRLTLRDLLKITDNRLYLAKRQGRNRVVSQEAPGKTSGQTPG
ncbi:MAG: GGDEF domain-containing protein [Spirochaetales bacterium]|nr:GGDEF domain-containing protein [Spirochaetales bacterium]